MGCANSQEVTYLATVPLGASAGQTITVPLNGTNVLVMVPRGVSPGHIFRFKASEVLGNAPVQPQFQQQSAYNQPVGAPAPPALQSDQFRVAVPQGVYPGQAFDVNAPDGQRLRLVCPPNVYAGQTFIAQLPPPAPMPAVAAAGAMAYASDNRIPTKGMDDDFLAATPEVEAQAYDPSAFSGSAPVEVSAVPIGAAGISLAAGAAAGAAYGSSTKSSPPPAAAAPNQFKIVIPPGIRPGQNFEVDAGGARMMVQCPANAVPGSTITIQAPASSGSAPPSPVPVPMPGSAPSSPSSKGPPPGQMDIVVPANVEPGQTFEVVSNGTRIGVKCPPNTRPGQKIRIQIPANGAGVPSSPPAAASTPQTFQVQIPPGVAPGATFEVQVGGKRAMVQCPPGVQPGQTIQIAI